MEAGWEWLCWCRGEDSGEGRGSDGWVVPVLEKVFSNRRQEEGAKWDFFSKTLEARDAQEKQLLHKAHIPRLVDKIIWQQASWRAGFWSWSWLNRKHCRCVRESAAPCQSGNHSQLLQSTSANTQSTEKPPIQIMTVVSHQSALFLLYNCSFFQKTLLPCLSNIRSKKSILLIWDISRWVLFTFQMSLYIEFNRALLTEH